LTAYIAVKSRPAPGTGERERHITLAVVVERRGGAVEREGIGLHHEPPPRPIEVAFLPLDDAVLNGSR
jgi:hypothetical protein